MSELDWSAPRKTPAGTRDGGSVPEQAPRAPGQPLTTRSAGSMRDHDDLCEALAVYEAEDALGGRTDHLYGRLMDVSALCGRPFGTPALGWSRRRVNAYRNMIGAGQ